jgi:hypothetical protein
MNVAQSVSEVGGRLVDGEDVAYSALVAQVGGAFGLDADPLFTTDAEQLWDAFLGGLPEGRRQHYTCRACRTFVERFGGLVTIDGQTGALASPLWNATDGASTFFVGAVTAMRFLVLRARVTGVFLSNERVWGTPHNASPKSPTGTWNHLFAIPHPHILHRETPVATYGQAMAEKVQDHHMLKRGLAEFPIELVRQAYTLLSTGALYRSERCIGIAKWLLDLHEAISPLKNTRHRDNLVWRAVATAPAGFCHIRTTMISTLLEDLAAGKAFADIKRAFDAKMNPLEYQRPQAAPSDGQLAAAEAVVAKLNAAGALARRFARLDEVLPYALWRPRPAAETAPPGGGVFDHLRAKRSTPAAIDVPAQVMTWEKFRRTVLSEAERIEYLVAMGRASFFAFVTAEDPNAPPILQWDTEEHRNPVNWYFYPNGSLPQEWALTWGQHVEVEAITAHPSAWGTRELAHHGGGACFILRGARDVHARGGLALFPENLRSEYHGIRAAIEAFSRAGKLGNGEGATACGVAMTSNGTIGRHTFRVTSKGARVSYTLDRWD